MTKFLVLLMVCLVTVPAHAVVYLCPTDGNGSDTNLFRSRAISELLPGRGNIDMRTDATKPGLMLCESDVLPTNMAGVIVLGDTRSALLAAKVKEEIATSTTATIRGVTVEDAIKELVIPRLHLPKSGSYEIRLGTTKPTIKEVASLSNDIYYKGLAVALKEHSAQVLAAVQASVAWATTLATETWNCANAVSLDCVLNWADKTGTTFDIVSNQASASGSSTHETYANASLATVDHEASVTVVNATRGGTGTLMSCSVLGRTTNDATRTFYRTVASLASSGELNSVILIRTVAAAGTTLATDTTDFSNGDTITIRMIGDTISSRKNDVEILSVTDATISTGTYVGIRYSADGASANCTLDNLNAQDISTGFFLRRRTL